VAAAAAPADSTLTASSDTDSTPAVSHRRRLGVLVLIAAVSCLWSAGES